MLPPHVALLLSCAATRPGTGVPVPPDIDWPLLAALLEHHGMAPHAHQVLSQRGGVPAEPMQSLRAAHERTSQRSLLLTARLLQLLNDLEHADVPVLTLKGPALSQQLYGEPAMREFVDLDLLVRVEDVNSIAGCLHERGYALESELGWLGLPTLVRQCAELTFRNAAGTAVDLHWTATPANHPFTISTSRLWSSVSFVSIGGRRVPVLAPECLLLFLCIHGARHCWTKLRWLCDVAMLLSTAEPVDWDTVVALAEESHASHALSLGLLLAHDVLNADVPAGLLHQARTTPTVVSLAAAVTRQLEASAPQEQPTSRERTIFNARLAATGWLRVRHIAALMKAPTEADAEFVRLPRPLLFLYYPLRAARLAAKYGHALVAG